MTSTWTPTRRSPIALVTLAAAGLGAVTANAAGAAGPARAHHTAASTATIGTRHERGLGTFLVDRRSGRTVYLFEKDSRNHSRCGSRCAPYWPPVMTGGRPHAIGRAQARKLGRIKRGSGWQVTYGGHPLYTYVGDAAAGQTNGQGLSAFGARWYVVSPRGSGIDR